MYLTVLNSKDLVSTASARWNNELTVYKQTFSNTIVLRLLQNNHKYYCSVSTI